MPTGGRHEYQRAWAPEEDDIATDLVERYGNIWTKIAEALIAAGYTDRTTSSVRNRYGRILRAKKEVAAGGELKNRCHLCGNKKRGHTCRARLNGGPQVTSVGLSTAMTPMLLPLEPMAPLAMNDPIVQEACDPQPLLSVPRAPLACFVPRSPPITNPVCSTPQQPHTPERLTHELLPPTLARKNQNQNISFLLAFGGNASGVSSFSQLALSGEEESGNLILPEGFSFTGFLNDESVDLSPPDGLSFSKLLAGITTDESADAL